MRRLSTLGGATIASSALFAVMLAAVASGGGAAYAATSLINDSFANPTTTAEVIGRSNGKTGVSGQSFPCLTAAPVSPAPPSTIGNCNLPAPDPAGSGALMLTDQGFQEASNVIYSNSFPTANGLDITFDTHMYGGPVSVGGKSSIGIADGISFDLATAPPAPGAVGQPGGALGYSTDLGPGMPAGYLGIGLDEYGNYSTTGFENVSCPNPSWAGFSPNQVTVRGPGNGTAGYCLLSSSRQDTPDPMSSINLHGADFASSTVAVHVVIDTTTDPANPTYSISLEPSGASSFTPVTSGPLPNFYYDPVSGAKVLGIPSRLTFAIAASTGDGNDIHEINLLQTSTESSNPLTTLDLAANDDSAHQVPMDAPFNYVFTPQVNPASAASEASTVTVLDQLPAGQVLTGTFSGTGWSCPAINTVTNTIKCQYTPGTAVPAGEPLPPLSIGAIAPASSPGATVTDTASVSSADSQNVASATDTATLANSTLPLLDAVVSDSDGGQVSLGSSFNLLMSASADAFGAAETRAPTITSSVPPQLTITGSPSGPGWDCGASDTSSNSVKCTYTGSLPIPAGAGQVSPVTVPVALSAGDSPGDVYSVPEAVTSSDASTYWAASTAADAVSVNYVNLVLNETDNGLPTSPGSPDNVYAGTNFDYILSVSVPAGTTAESDPITLLEAPPSQVTFTGLPYSKDSHWDCSGTDLEGGLLSCVYTPDPGTAVAPGMTLPPVYAPVFMGDTTIGDQPSDASAAYSNDSPFNCCTSDTVTVIAAPVTLDLNLTDSTGSSHATPTGTDFTYSTAVTVDGASTEHESQPIKYTDTLPAGATLTGVQADPTWDCSASDLATNLVSCTYTPPPGGIAPGTALPVIAEDAHLNDPTSGDTLGNTGYAGSSDASQVTSTDTVAVGLPLLTITAQDASTTYGLGNPAFNVSYNGFHGSDNPSNLTGSLDCTSSETGTSPVGTYPITCSGLSSPNYSIDYVAGTLTVDPATLTVTASNTTTTYGTTPAPTPQYSGFVNGENSSVVTTAPTCSSTASAATPVGVDAGSNSCTGGAATNYTLTYVSGIATVNPATLTVTASNTATPYGTVPFPESQYSGFVNGENSSVVTAAPTCSSTVTATFPVGTYRSANICTGGAATNYSLNDVDGNATVGRATLTVTASNTKTTYGTTPAPTPQYSGFVNGENSSVVTAAPTCSSTVTATRSVGTYPGANSCTGGAATNYTLTYVNGTATINAATLTVTASNTITNYGTTPAPTPQYSGFVNGQNSSVVTTSPTCSSTVTATFPVGTYPSANMCTGGAAPNYTLTYVSGTATVVPGPPATLTFTQEPRDTPLGVAISPAVQVTVVDAHGIPIPSSNVTLSPTGGSYAFTGTSTLTQTTNSSGVATFSNLVINQSGAGYTITATDGSANGVSTAFSVHGPVAAGASTVVANPTSVANDGVSSSTVTVTLKDSVGTPVSGQTVTLSQGSGHSVITMLSGVTNSAGQATFKVTDTTAEVVTYSATDVSQSGLPITQTASVTFHAATYTTAQGFGYWKNHQSQTTALLPQMLGNYNVQTWTQATAVFNATNCSGSTANNAIGCLSGQLLGTELSLASGSNPVSCVITAVQQATAFLKSLNYVGPSGNYTLTASQRQTATSLSTTLEHYNSGSLTC